MLCCFCFYFLSPEGQSSGRRDRVNIRKKEEATSGMCMFHWRALQTADVVRDFYS